MKSPPRWSVWFAVAVIAVAAAAIALMVLLPDALVPDAPGTAESRHLRAEASIRATVLQTVGGLVILVGLGFTARSVYVSRETHLTDRLTKAVDQLGHQKPEVRVGGIYALQRLARNSRVDRGAIANILVGYLTINAAIATAPAAGTVTPDVQTALTVLTDIQA